MINEKRPKSPQEIELNRMKIFFLPKTEVTHVAPHICFCSSENWNKRWEYFHAQLNDGQRLCRNDGESKKLSLKKSFGL